MHFGPVDSYNGLKRRSLERTIFVSGGLRSRYPPKNEQAKQQSEDVESIVTALINTRMF